MTVTVDAMPARAAFSALAERISELVVSNFGSSADRGRDLPAEIRKLITLIEIDANAGAQIPDSHYGKIIRVRKGVAGHAGRRDFYVSRYPGACSVLPSDRKLVAQYGMERFLETVETRQVECVTVQQVLQEHGLISLDFLKTDLEGLDFEVIKSCEHLLEGVLAIQAELRFQPFFVGEPKFHEVLGYLSERGFDVVGIKPEWWKYNTPHRDRQRKGRAVWADVVFFKSPAELIGTPQGAISLAKQIVLAVMLRHENYAEFLLNEFESHLPVEIRHDLQALIAMRASSQQETLSAEFPHAAIE